MGGNIITLMDIKQPSDLLNKIVLGNCLDTMAKMPDNFIDLTLTSPPYDNLRKYTDECAWNEDIWKSIIKELFRVSKKGGVVVWIVGDATVNGSETGTSFKQTLYAMECGFNLHDTMIFAKNNLIPLNHNRYDPQFEYMFIWSKGKPKKFNPIKQKCKTFGDRKNYSSTKVPVEEENKYAIRKREVVLEIKEEKNLSNIWFFTIGIAEKNLKDDINKHPAPFPEKLANDHIITWSDEGDLVYDPFMGSGTTAKMAISNNRNFIGSEISKKYCKIAENRIGYSGLHDFLNNMDSDIHLM